MAEISSESQFFSGNIANMIPKSPLNKMVPLTEDHGCVWGGAWGPPLAHGLTVILTTFGVASDENVKPNFHASVYQWWYMLSYDTKHIAIAGS